MIRRADELELLTQPDHAALAVALAERWGGGDFTLPATHQSLICAAVHHDDGRYELDQHPAFDADAGGPAHFTEIPLTESSGPDAHDPHHALNTPVGDPDPAADSDPYRQPTSEDEQGRASGSRGEGQGAKQ